MVLSFDFHFRMKGHLWNSIDTLDLTGFWQNQGAISHVTIFGGSTPVPEPATMLLLGTGLVGLAATARRKMKKS